MLITRRKAKCTEKKSPTATLFTVNPTVNPTRATPRLNLALHVNNWATDRLGYGWALCGLLGDGFDFVLSAFL
jgi:hypothetical protein